ncbi:Sodium:dicarboxylate symporter [Cystobasidium minutum MCA 4210]|uniref:Sodium:dicarboxylate symporter n=1 Tax=Cystobasidium minutum MCA 4210 TaxID=1397322 RepID=UPI0034CD17CA|eukprot:jgi/Rhomi1/140956/e_gw1.2.236.1
MLQDSRTKKPWWHPIKEPGSAVQIVIAAALALAIGLGVSSATDVPDTATTLLAIPGQLWLRALTCVVLPLIVCSMILAVQRLREISKGGHILARYTIGFYILTTLVAIVHSTILTALVWRNLFQEVGSESLEVSASDADTVAEREDTKIEEVVVDMFNSLIPKNIVASLADNALLSVLVASIVVGYLIRDKDSTILKLAKEIERMITTIIGFLIKLAPIGVFFLILSSIMRLNIAELGENIGILIGGTLANMTLHLAIVLPGIYFIVMRKNPYAYWIKCSRSWITAWGTASSAGTLPVTLQVVKERGLPDTVTKFSVPLGTLVNMDGTAIYFPVVVNFLAATQGITLNAANYVILVLLSTLASIGTTPIPSASLVLVVMICGSVDVPITGMYAVVVAIDWFLDRFRTAINVSGDLYGAAVVSKLSGIQDPVEQVDEDPNAEKRSEGIDVNRRNSENIV